MSPRWLYWPAATGATPFATIEGTTDSTVGSNSKDTNPTVTGTTATITVVTLYGNSTFGGMFQISFGDNTNRDQYVSDVPDSTSGTTYIYELSTDGGSTWLPFNSPAGWNWRLITNGLQLRGDFSALPDTGISTLPVGTMYRMSFYS